MIFAGAPDGQGPVPQEETRADRAWASTALHETLVAFGVQGGVDQVSRTQALQLLAVWKEHILPSRQKHVVSTLHSELRENVPFRVAALLTFQAAEFRREEEQDPADRDLPDRGAFTLCTTGRLYFHAFPLLRRCKYKYSVWATGQRERVQRELIHLCQREALLRSVNVYYNDEHRNELLRRLNHRRQYLELRLQDIERDPARARREADWEAQQQQLQPSSLDAGVDYLTWVENMRQQGAGLYCFAARRSCPWSIERIVHDADDEDPRNVRWPFDDPRRA